MFYQQLGISEVAFWQAIALGMVVGGIITGVMTAHWRWKCREMEKRWRQTQLASATPLCQTCADLWFCARDLLPGDPNNNCIVCAFLKREEYSDDGCGKSWKGMNQSGDRTKDRRVGFEMKPEMTMRKAGSRRKPE